MLHEIELPVRAVLFDMDGVLLFSEEAWFAVYNDTLEHFGHAPIERAAFDRIYGNGTEADRDRYMPERAIREIDEAYAMFFEKHLAHVKTNEEALPVLEELRRRGIATSLATNTNRPLAEELLRRAGLLSALDHVACADEVAAGKPDPALLHLASRRLGIPLGEAFFVGDSRYDAEAAAAAPVRFAGYRFGSGRRIQSLRELLAPG
ncbi:MAG: HAD-IA family hydrolase [Thermoanaerobaculia bacterium]